MNMDLNGAVAVKRQNFSHLMKRKNVVGVGVGYKVCAGKLTDEVAVTINVMQKVPSAQLAPSDEVPKEVDGLPTDVVETGRFLAIEAGETPLNTQERWRPTIPPGVSIGHIAVTAGTFGCLVRRGNDIFILSNNHVLANVNMAEPGDTIIQPARYDNGSEPDKVAILAEYIPLDFGGESASCNVATGIQKALNWTAQAVGSKHRMIAYRSAPGENLVDAALARPLDPDQFIPEILEIGRPKGIHEATLGTNVQKMGRTTGFTQGYIMQVDVTTSVDYNGRMATFTHQLMATGMSTGGDSGSAVLDEEGYVIGLLYAGSGRATLINPIDTVLRLLNVELIT
jgi:hypothetical protein